MAVSVDILTLLFRISQAAGFDLPFLITHRSNDVLVQYC